MQKIECQTRGIKRKEDLGIKLPKGVPQNGNDPEYCSCGVTKMQTEIFWKIIYMKNILCLG